MTSKLFSSLALAAVGCLGLSLSARANDVPVSLLVYPTFDNTRGAITLITVTNTNSDQTLNAQNQPNGTVRVEWVYINSVNCQETNLTRTLTPNDTFTANSRTDNPNAAKGYVYAFAKNLAGQAIKFDWLIGLEEVFDGATADYFQVKPYGFKAGAGLANGANTDVAPTANGRRDLNGVEYEAAPDDLLSPRFLGQLGGASTDLILINLTGGSQFSAIVDFLIYNDQEDQFSAQYTFTCWVRVPLLAINGVFGNTFLQGTNTNNENVLGNIETGWFRMNGLQASSLAFTIQNPAILAMQIDRGVVGIGSAFLPYCTGSNTTGSLLAHSFNGQ